MKGRRWPSLPRVDVVCGHCKKPLQRSAAVKMNGAYYHPHPCFGRALAEQRAQLDLLTAGLK
jgi:hypothetical protein